MRKTLVSIIIAVFICAVFSIPDVRQDSSSGHQECLGNISLLNQFTKINNVQNVYAAPRERDEDRGRGSGRGRGSDRGRGSGRGRGGGRGRDRDRGPSVPGIPMAAAVLVGLGAIGVAGYFLTKKKSCCDKDASDGQQ
ncbi:MAG: hypothetical protein JW983_01665 [Elusimicrobia bacterium]|nr:hypothetical protein [Elusimicrobiota bacterium]